jgi:SAM-dependent methyltransferase
VKSYEDWFAYTWRFVQPALPAAPATVLEIGCGRFGGFVPRLLAAGYDAVGVDPNAPDGLQYAQCEFEKYDGPTADVIIACTSLHHAADLDLALDQVARAQLVVVIECAHERFDERTAQWCFAHLSNDGEQEPGWLHTHQEQFADSGLPWDAYRDAWVEREGLHHADRIVAGLDARFDRATYAEGPYYFADLDRVPAEAEQAAIDAGLINPVGVYYVARAASAAS